ncbi:MAG: cation diffusion facilitator family transporter [Bacteroidales bacterium]
MSQIYLFLMTMDKKARIAQRTRLGNIEGWLSIAGNFFLFGLKYWAGVASGSVALIADAWHTLSDSFSSVIVLLGMRISKKPADKEHPFGHGRAELIASLVIGVLLSVIAFTFIMEGIEKIKTQDSANYGLLALIAVLASIAVKEGLAQFAFRAGKKTGSNTLKADGWHHRTDALSSVLLLAGIFLGDYLWWIDGVLAIIVALMIAYAAYEILKDAIDPLMGEKPTKKLVSQLEEISRKELGYNPEIHHIHIHRYGEHVELTFHVLLSPEMSLKEAHDYIEKLEKKIDEELEMSATIHPEPR